MTQDPPILPKLYNPNLKKVIVLKKRGLEVHIDLNWEDNILQIKEKMLKMKKNNMEVGELVLKFFYTFGYIIPESNETISIKEARLIPQGSGLLGYSMQDPFIEFNDMCRHLRKDSRQYLELLSEFRRAFECIKDGKIKVLTEEFKGFEREVLIKT